MRRVLLGLGVCALALAFTQTASAGWHTARCYYPQPVIVQPCQPVCPAPVIVTQPVCQPPVVYTPPCTAVVETCQPVTICQPTYRYYHTHYRRCR